MLRAVSFLKQFGEGILTLKLCCGHSRSCSGLLEAFLLWSYVEGTLVLEAVCWEHFYFEAMLRALSFLKQSAGGIFTLKLCWRHSRPWSNLLGRFYFEAMLRALSFLSLLGALLLWSYVEGNLVLAAVCWEHFYFEAMLRAILFLQRSAGGMFTLSVESAFVLEAVWWGHFDFEAMLRALSFLKKSAGGIFILKLCCGHSRSWSSLLGAFLLSSYVAGTLVLEAVWWGHFGFEAMLRALSFLIGGPLWKKIGNHENATFLWIVICGYELEKKAFD